MSVLSDTYGYKEICGKSHEFVRRGCTNTPLVMSWAGDLLLVKETLLKQSLVTDIRGGNESIAYTHETTECDDMSISLPAQYTVEETGIRTGEYESFNFAIEDEAQWDTAVYQSLDDCGKMMDGGDALQIPNTTREVISLCGTVRRNSGVGDPQAHYLDNRMSYSKDQDNGLLVAIRTGLVWNWEVFYSPKERILTEGLMRADDVTVQFMEQITALGMTQEDIFEFGMI